MPGIDYEELAGVALELISDAGGVFILRTFKSTAPNPDKDWEVIESDPEDVNCTAVIIPEGSKRNIYIAAAGLSIEPLDSTKVVTPNGDVFAFVNGSISKIEPAGDGRIVLYIGELVAWPT